MFCKILSVVLVEKVAYLQTHTQDTPSTLLRGVVRLALPSQLVVHAITVQLVGTAKTLWPGGTAPTYTLLNVVAEHWQKQTIVDCTLSVLERPISLIKGTHEFPFAIHLSNRLSESIECRYGRVSYKLHGEAHVKSMLPWPRQLHTKLPVELVRLPPTDCVPSFTNTVDDTTVVITLGSSHLRLGDVLLLTIATGAQQLTLSSLTVKLIERQKISTSSRCRLFSHQVTLFPDRCLDAPCPLEETMCISYPIPGKESLLLHASTTNSTMRVRHWLDIALLFLLPDNTTKEIKMYTPIMVVPNNVCDILPAYQLHSPRPTYECH
ncbi:hypothetical protein BDF14DRAFT_1832756 [Spinellus fusiger]|nr:hypothetical protein BDF14DRAFT_1832756 [Spinellus fusiger]